MADDVKWNPIFDEMMKKDGPLKDISDESLLNMALAEAAHFGIASAWGVSRTAIIIEELCKRLANDRS